MDETTRKQTLEAVRELYAKRLRLIDRAIKAAELAQERGTFTTFFWNALENLRLARIQTEVDRDNQIGYWEDQE